MTIYNKSERNYRGKCLGWFVTGEFEQTTTATATRTSPNKRFNEENNGCARAF